MRYARHERREITYGPFRQTFLRMQITLTSAKSRTRISVRGGHVTKVS